MSLDEAIKYYSHLADECRRKARIERNDYMDLKDLAAEHEQLADWLNELKVLREKIQKLLEKQEQDRWHSIAKEGKPKESGTYIWTCDDGTHRKLVTVAKYFKRTGECILTGARSYWKAKAWKPLPEPYEEEKNNDDVD